VGKWECSGVVIYSSCSVSEFSTVYVDKVFCGEQHLGTGATVILNPHPHDTVLYGDCIQIEGL